MEMCYFYFFYFRKTVQVCMIFLRLIVKLAKLLRSGTTPSHIASGFVLGMMIGLISFKSLFTPFLVLIIIIFNVNIASAIFAAVLFRAIAVLIDPFLHFLGYWLLVDITFLREVWTSLYNIPFFRYTRFNNTVVLGSLVVALCLIYPLYTGIRVLIIGYREKYEERIKKWKIIKILRGSKIFQFLGGIKDL